MLTDLDTQFSNHQTLTETALSTSSIASSDAKDAAAGEQLVVWARVDAAVEGIHSLQAELVAADNAALTTNVVSVLSETLDADGGMIQAGAFDFESLPVGLRKAHLGMRYTVEAATVADLPHIDIVHAVDDTLVLVFSGDIPEAAHDLVLTVLAGNATFSLTIDGAAASEGDGTFGPDLDLADVEAALDGLVLNTTGTPKAGTVATIRLPGSTVSVPVSAGLTCTPKKR